MSSRPMTIPQQQARIRILERRAAKTKEAARAAAEQLKQAKEALKQARATGATG